MAKIVEIYPDVESVQAQIKVRETFGWSSSVELTERGVFEVTFTRNDNTARNKKLKVLEDDFNECFAAEDYIERYNEVRVDERKFKSMSVFAWIVAIYFMISLAFQGVACCAIYGIYQTQPELIISQMSITDENGNKISIDENWSKEINLEEAGVYEILKTFGVKEKVVTINTDFLVKALLGLGIISLVGFIIILAWVCNRKRKSKLYYKAELEYVQNRKDLLNSKIDYLEERMDEIIDNVAAV